MRVLQVCAEMVPWVKTGGLADVVGALPAALAGCGVELRALLPGYPVILQALQRADSVGRSRLPWGDEVGVLRASAPGSDTPLYLIDAPWLYARGAGPYEDAQGYAYADNHRRFAALAWVARDLACGLDPAWQPQVVHAHDWHAALVPLYLALCTGGAQRRPSVFTIHNLAYQGVFRPVHLAELGIPAQAWHMEGVEYHGQIGFLKAGIVYADQVTTVSASYAREIQTPEQGFGLDGLLRRHQHKLLGIRNGIDSRIWDPRSDPHLPAHYAVEDLRGRERNHLALGEELGLPAQHHAPRCAVLSRLHPHKGLGLVLDAAERMLQDGAQLAILGRGEFAIEQAFRALETRHPEQVRVRLGFDEALAHRLLAGCDMLLMPSQFEPCGLTQMYAMRYGCVPLVHAVGGLADTVIPWQAASGAAEHKAGEGVPPPGQRADTDPAGGIGRSGATGFSSATGFSFTAFETAAFLGAWQAACACWLEPKRWLALQRAGMSLAFDWSEPARQYTRLYHELGSVYG